MNASIKRLRFGLTTLGGIFILAVAGYWLGAGWTLFDSFYMVVSILTTVGLAEVQELTPPLKMFTAVVMAFGVSAALYIMGVFVQMMTEGEINRALGLRRVGRDIQRLSQHVIICGFGRMGEILADELQRRKKSFVIVQQDAERIAEATERGYLAIHGDASEEDVLESLGLVRAKTLVTTLPHDADNVFITLTCRNLNPDLHIIARGEFPSTEKKLLQAGADRVVLPAATGALRMAAMITRPSTVELVEMVAGRSIADDVEVDELVLQADNSLVGRTVGETDIRSRHGLLVVGVRHSNDKLDFAPGADCRFQPDDRVIVIGHVNDIESFRKEYDI